jgi:hypothetical protein
MCLQNWDIGAVEGDMDRGFFTRNAVGSEGRSFKRFFEQIRRSCGLFNIERFIPIRDAAEPLY